MREEKVTLPSKKRICMPQADASTNKDIVHWTVHAKYQIFHAQYTALLT